MYIVTGGLGFIGSNIVKALNDRNIEDIIVVDDVSNETAASNISDCKIQDVIPIKELQAFLRCNEKTGGKVDAVFHKGACSDTTETNREYIISINYEYSIEIINFCLRNKVPLIYASSAAVYGSGDKFYEDPKYEKPLNLYAESKYLFDNHVRALGKQSTSQVVGLRYFNVYGPREQHKGYMASVAYRFRNQILETGKAKLFESCESYQNGDQQRDFIYVGDAVNVNLWFLDHPEISGIFNVGTGRSQTFNDVANAVIKYYNRGEIEYISFDKKLIGKYQSFTQANISKLRDVGYTDPFYNVEKGVFEYMKWLDTASIMGHCSCK